MKNLLSAILVLVAISTHAQITSTFDSDADGWTFYNNGTPVTVNHNASNGNPGGFVATAPYSSNATATSQGWFAPAKFLGQKALRSYGMNLHFDLQGRLPLVRAMFVSVHQASILFFHFP
jgi:hypothetical protein